MREFLRVVESIASILERMSHETEISPEMIPRIVSDALSRNNNFNCYPGSPSHMCCKLAVFVSLQANQYRKRWPGGYKHMSFHQALAMIVKHMQGSCHGITTHAIFIADTWDVNAYKTWEQNLKTIKSQFHLEEYLIVSGHAIPIPH